jgi:hypothetical protein
VGVTDLLKAAVGFYNGSEFISDNIKEKTSSPQKNNSLNDSFNDLLWYPQFRPIIN